jgi:methylase of polypeptide subunit release factors
MAAETETKFTAEQVVCAAYHALLGRDPDEEGRRAHTAQLRESGALSELFRNFLGSPEFGVHHPAILAAHESQPKNAIQLQLSDSEHQLLWQHVRNTWTRLGQEDPYFSVVTSDQYRQDRMSPDAGQRFYDSGQVDLNRVEAFLSRNGRELPRDGVCVDYGCGLGRITLWLAKRCKRVIAVDVSEAHLAIARRELAARGVANVEFHLLRGRGDLAALNGADLFHSIIVLQHNPPPIIAEILNAALKGLKNGGSAFFQVPTYGSNYHWSYDRFIADDLPAGDMEMHVIPQSVVFALAAEAGCVPVEVQPDGCAGMPFWVSNSFLFSKPAASRLLHRGGFARAAAVAGRLLARLGPAYRPQRSARR